MIGVIGDHHFEIDYRNGPGEGAVKNIGRMTMMFCESIEPLDSGAELHPGYDETFIIRESRYEFQLGDNLLNFAGPIA